MNQSMRGEFMLLSQLAFPHHAKCHTVQEAPWVEAGSGAVSPSGGDDKEWDATEKKKKTPYHL